MDGRKFDVLTRTFAMPRTRRSTLKAIALGLGIGSLAPRGESAWASNDCAEFCLNLPPGHRGRCVSECQAGTGLYFECGGDPLHLCIATDGSSAVCCGEGTSCQDGGCSGCPDYYAYCELSNQCVSTFCNYRKQYNPATCQCECEPQYIPLVNTGACATPCSSDADCGGYPGGCRTNVEGQQVCGHCGESAYSGCTNYYPCTNSAFCQSCAFAINTYCAEGVCYTSC